MSLRPRLVLLWLAVATVLVPALSGGARADVGPRLPRIGRLAEEVSRAGFPHAYVPLRKLWGEWEGGDPAAVEEALRAVAADTRVSPPVRAYAGLLDAYGRRRRGDLAGAKSRIRELGWVGRWITVGPFDNEGKGGLDRELGPEADLEEPINLGRTYDGKERPVSPRVAPDVFPYGWVDLGAVVRPQEKVCAYATTFVKDKREGAKARRISIWFGSAGASKVFWGKSTVIRDDKYRDLDADRFSAVVDLKPGWNRLTVKVCGDDDPAMFSLRLADAAGAPDDNLIADANPEHARQASAQRFHKSPGLAPAPRAPDNKTPQMGGAVPTFEKLVARGGARDIEAYARYLVLTRSDDSSEHRARTLAHKVAGSSPTIARALLAGELAENRNQRALWIDKAEDMVAKGGSLDDRVDVLLARATHARGGPNWRDAMPYYEKVLALDPDNMTANLARTEIFAEAGLRETALASLLALLERHPRSVALLRATVAALRELDRTTEAGEMLERYAAVRFDDPDVPGDQIDLAVAHRDAARAERWIRRLLDTSPDNARALATAARAYVTLGQRAQAVAAFRRALDLAPEDTAAMRALAGVYAVGGQKDEQLRLLKRVLELQPQDKDVREYVAHAEPSRPRVDETYARKPEEFLKGRAAPSKGENRRTLVDLQVTTVFPNGLASRFHQVVYQPLTDAAAAQAREYAFSFEADTETVQLRGARIYRKSGQVDEAIESGEGANDNPSIAMYTSSRTFYVHFARLDPGDVVELLYRVEDVAQRNAFADYFGEVVYMQSGEPIGRSEYVLITPKTRTFYFNEPKVKGLTKTQEDKGDQRIFRFVAQDVAPIEPEPMQPPYAETLGHVHVSTYKSWDEMGRWYWGLVKDQFVADEEVRRRVAEITKGLTDDRAKVRAVYDWVVQRTRYVALEFGIHGFKPYRCAQIFARGFGDCKDKATLIVTMLRELGISATIVILRTGMRGDFETSPASLAPFDHAIAYVPSMDLYLDGTAEYTGSTELPAMDRGALAIQINEGKPKLVHLPMPPASESVTARRLEAQIAGDGSAQFEWKVDVSGVSAPAWRQRYLADATRTKRLQEDVSGELPNLEIANVQASDLADIEKPVELRAKGKVPRLARREGETWTVPAGPSEHMVRDYASLSARKHDLRISSLATHVHERVLKLPAGARVVTPPNAKQGSSPFGSYAVEVESSPGSVRIKTSVAISKSRIAASEYAAFRAFCEEVDRALGQTLTYATK